MCVSLHPAHFTDTIVGVFEGPDGRRYLAYQNCAVNLVGTKKNHPAGYGTRSSVEPLTLTAPQVRRDSHQWDFETAIVPEPLPAAKAGGNAMILPIPDSVDSIQVIDTTSCPKFLKDIRESLTPRTRGGLLSFGVSKGMDVRIINFDIYTIVIAANAAAMAEVLQSDAIPEDRRPAINEAMIAAYTEWYPGWAIAVCCFNTDNLEEGKPLLFSYLPSKQEDPDCFHIPMLDAHDGKVPNLTARVKTDHTVFVATSDMKEHMGHWVYYTDHNIAPSIAERLPQHIVGRQLTAEMPNGDLVFRRADLKEGNFRGLRALPPGAKETTEKFFVS